VHGKTSQVDQIDCLGVSLDEEGESFQIKSWKRHQISALSFVLTRAVNFDQRAFLFVDKTDPRHAPTANNELVRCHLHDLGDQVVHKKKVRCDDESLPRSLKLSKVETTRTGESELVL